MPEIAEVRLIADNVRDFLLNNILTSIDVRTSTYTKKSAKLINLPKVLPQLITAVKTKGKFTYILLENGDAVGYGLGMSGNVRIEPTPEHLSVYNKNRGKNETAESYLKHAHLKINYLEKGTKKHFYYHDVRRFGTWEYLTGLELAKKLETIGTDLIDEELKKVDAINLLRRYNTKNICSALLDQSILGGVGNYMKAEILYTCKVHPLAKFKDLDDEILYQIYLESRIIAEKAYRFGGAGLYSFTGMQGDQSDFKKQLRIYNHNVDPFGNKVERIQNTRSPDKRTIHWVPAVQTLGGPAIAVEPKRKIFLKLKSRE